MERSKCSCPHSATNSGRTIEAKPWSMRGGERVEDLERLAVAGRQGRLEADCGLAQPLHDAERVEIVGGE
jgi:hypothetical protein